MDGGDRHAVFSDGSRLVRADDTGAPQRFYAVQPVHQSVALHHAVYRQCQRNGDRCRKPLRDGSDGDGDAGHEHIKDRFAPEHACQKDRAAYAQTEQRHHLSQSGKALLQRCHILLDLLEHGGDLSHLGACAGGNDSGFGAAPEHSSPGIDHIPLVEIVAALCRIACLLGDRLGFSGENGLVDLQSCRLEQGCVCRHIVTGFQPDAVAADQLPCRKRLPLSVAADGGCGCGETAQGFQCLFCAVLLQKAQNGIEQDNENDGDCIGDLAEKCRDSCGGQQDQHHHIPKLPQKHPQGMELCCGCQFIFSVLLQTFPRCFGCQTVHMTPSF